MMRVPITYEFGPFRLDAGRRLLLRDGVHLSVPPKALETLVVLIEDRDRIVTKDELLSRIWGTVVVEEGGLARNVSLLRKVLGEKPEDHRYIVTIPGQGYRFVADVRQSKAAEPPVEQNGVGATVEVAIDSPAPADHPSRSDESRDPGPTRWVAFAAVGVAVVAALVAALVFVFRAGSSAEAARPAITALAVLPLQNLSGDASQEYFADGMTETLIATLARVRAVRVVSRTSVMRFKSVSRGLPEIAQALGVDAVIEGSVRRTGNRVRITVQLIHAATDTHLWAREYERELTDVLRLQSEVARAIAAEIQVRITAEEQSRLAAADSVNPAAYEEFLLGKHYLWRLNEEDLARAIAHFEQSIRLDPLNAATHAALSHAWWWRGVWGAPSFPQVEAPSRAAAARALELDPGLAEAYVSRGRIKFGHEWDWTGARVDFERALDIDPNNVDAHFFSAMLCMAVGCLSQSIDHMRRVEAVDPLSPTVQSFLGRVLYRARRFDEAVAHLERAIELEPQGGAGAYYRLAEVHEARGRYKDSLAVLDRAEAVAETRPSMALLRARIHARMGDRDHGRALLETSTRHPPRLMATFHAAIGDNDQAFRLLFKAMNERPTLDAFVKTDPPFDSLHADPRWAQVLRRMNLPLD